MTMLCIILLIIVSLLLGLILIAAALAYLLRKGLKYDQN